MLNANANNSVEQTKGLTRNTVDKYYTKPEIVCLCIEYVKQYVNITTNDLIIEPSAGNGAFISAVKTLTNNYLFYDLEPEHPEIIKQNYLELKLSPENTATPIHVIGNPPFGRQSSLAIKFIKKSCIFCSSLSFILPKSFKKDSLQKIFPLNFHLAFEMDLPNKSFLVNNKEHDVPCVFQIWIKQTSERQLKNKLEPINFIFVDKTETPDISFRRVGVNAGTIDVDINTKSPQSHYFIKFINPDKSIPEIVALLSTISYDFNNTVGPKSISKQELIAKFNPITIHFEQQGHQG